MAKRRKKKAAKSARRPKPAKKTRKPARKPARKAKPVRQASRPARTPGRKTAKKSAKNAARKPAVRKAARKPASKAPARKAPAKKAAPVRAAAKPARGAAVKPAAAPKKVPQLDRDRRRLADTGEDLVPSAPSTLGYEGGSSAARSGRSEMREARTQHTETGPALTGGDVDASWEDAYAVGDEAPGGDNPTPDQDRVDDIGKALGVEYNDNEELKGAEKIQERDRHRWELDPASSDDYVDRRKEED